MMKMQKVKPKTEKYMTDGPVGLKKGESKPQYPTVRFQLEHIPEAKDCKIGEMCEVHMKGKVISLSQSRFDNSMELEMHEVGMEKCGKEEKGEHKE